MTQITLIFLILIWMPLFIVLFRFHKNPDPHLNKEAITFENRVQKRLYTALRNNGYYVRVKEKCGPYTLDLVLPYYRVALRCMMDAEKIEDLGKRNYLRKQGWKVVGVTEKDIEGKMTTVLHKIEAAVLEKIK